MVKPPEDSSISNNVENRLYKLEKVKKKITREICAICYAMKKRRLNFNRERWIEQANTNIHEW
jgi:hypothetical protein